jgi:hypothetical protein
VVILTRRGAFGCPVGALAAKKYAAGGVFKEKAYAIVAIISIAAPAIFY